MPREEEVADGRELERVELSLWYLLATPKLN